jgi:hypothetical protein
MSSGVSNPDEQAPGWNLEFKSSDWLDVVLEDIGDQMNKTKNPSKRELEDRFDTVGWGLLFLLFGALALPNGTAEYASAAVVGAAMVGLNLVRVFVDLPVRWFSIILGAVMLVAGTGALAGLHMDVFVLFFILAGVVTIAGALIGPRRATAS